MSGGWSITGGRILQIMPAPGLIADEDGSIYAGYALVEFDVDQDGTPTVARDILPFDTTGCLYGAPVDVHYLLHALGDHRPPFANPYEKDLA